MSITTIGAISQFNNKNNTIQTMNNTIQELNDNITALQQKNYKCNTVVIASANVLKDVGTAFEEYPLCERYMYPYVENSMERLGEVINE